MAVAGMVVPPQEPAIWEEEAPLDLDILEEEALLDLDILEEEAPQDLDILEEEPLLDLDILEEEVLLDLDILEEVVHPGLVTREEAQHLGLEGHRGPVFMEDQPPGLLHSQGLLQCMEAPLQSQATRCQLRVEATVEPVGAVV